MKIAKIIIQLLLVAAMPSHALANGRSAPAVERCYMDFPMPWQGYQYIPCWAVWAFS